MAEFQKYKSRLLAQLQLYLDMVVIYCIKGLLYGIYVWCFLIFVLQNYEK